HDDAAWIGQRRSRGEPGVVACSALRRTYRDMLRSADPALRIVFLAGDRDQLARRLSRRTAHFFPSMLLDSQLRTLEPPGADEEPLIIHIGRRPDETVELVLAALR